jgi:hypothetical protein
MGAGDDGMTVSASGTETASAVGSLVAIEVSSMRTVSEEGSASSVSGPTVEGTAESFDSSEGGIVGTTGAKSEGWVERNLMT